MDSPTPPEAPTGALKKKPAGGSIVKTVLLIGLPVFVLAVLISLNRGRTSVQEGDPAPGFTLPDLEGNPRSLADYRGKTVMVHFWATWCASCLREFPALQRMYKMTASDKFELLAISIESNGKKAVPRFVAQWPLEFQVLLDEKNSLAMTYGTTGVPETFLVDKNGVVVKKYIGPQEWDRPWFQKELKPLLN